MIMQKNGAGERLVPLITAQPDPRQMVQLGCERLHAGDLENAHAMFTGALQVDPDNADAYVNLSTLAAASGQKWTVAYHAAMRSLAMRPDFGPALSNAGVNAWRTGRLDQARKLLERAVELEPEAPGANHNMGLTYYALNKPEKAIACYRTALKTQPNNHGLRSDLALAVLKSGKLHEGLKLHEGRWDGMISKSPVWECGVPTWEGEDLNGKTIVIHHEQGFGDTIQFMRFMPELERKYPGANVKALVPQPLLRLMQLNYGKQVRSLDNHGDIVKSMMRADYHCPLLSLARVLGVEFGTLNAKPYLRAEERRPPMPAGTMRTPHTFNVGVIWAASPGHMQSRMRSVAVDRLLRLMEVPGVQLHSLQVGAFARELTDSGCNILIKDCVQQIRDFMDTANLMMELDLIISVDSGPAHLAGALGRPVWMFNPFTPCWRWCKGAGVWYETMTLWDQDRPVDTWMKVIERMAEKLAPMAAAKRDADLDASAVLTSADEAAHV